MDRNIVYEIYPHQEVVSISDVERVLGIPLCWMAKSLVVKARRDIVIAVLPGDRRLEKKKLSTTLACSRKELDLLKREEIERTIGIPVGAIPPFGLGLPVIIDERLMIHNRIFCGCGSLNRSLAISPTDLSKIANARIGDISTEIQTEVEK